ncbi:hypothetical protein DYB32_008375 [Aphanomyces invadans]|uniref:TOG domain-containing protein n=1 Tax=Aphanomyces invadans TaxID=157072 RepID=A0A3R6ZKA7_9STRA|nr:hypothetical protein DYB32_008375 [Aphanomyces invadans]
MEASVETLVYQMEDDDSSIKHDAIRKLREIAAELPRQSTVPPSFPVRNARRFLNCLRRRLHDTDRRVVVEALHLVCDLMPVLSAENKAHLAQIVLPPLLTLLPADDDWRDGAAFPQTALHVLWVYAQDGNDLRPIMDLLINQGLNHDDGIVRESAILAIKHLMLLNATATHACTLDYHMLVEVLIPSMEDDEESTVVAAEETLGWIQGHLGNEAFAKLAQRLNGRDKAILVDHKPFIAKFIPEKNAHDSRATASQLQFDLVPKWIVDVLTASTASSPEKLVAMDNLTQLVFDAEILTCQWQSLLAFLLSLCVVVPADSHRLVRSTLECIRHVVQAIQNRIGTVDGVFPVLVEVLSEMPQDVVLLDLLQLLFQYDRGVCGKLAPAFQHHSSRVREQACLVLLMFILRHPNESLPVAPLVQHLGRLLSDPSVRVRQTAMEVCAVLKHVFKLDMIALLRSNQDEHADAIDWHVLQRRLHQSFVPVLTARGSVCVDPSSPVHDVLPSRGSMDKSQTWLPNESIDGGDGSPSWSSTPPSTVSVVQPSAHDIAKSLATLKQRSLQKRIGKSVDAARTSALTPVEGGKYLPTGERVHRLRLPAQLPASDASSTATQGRGDDDRPIKPMVQQSRTDKPGLTDRPRVQNVSDSIDSRPIHPLQRQHTREDFAAADDCDDGMYYSPRTHQARTVTPVQGEVLHDDDAHKTWHVLEGESLKQPRVAAKRSVPSAPSLKADTPYECIDVEPTPDMTPHANPPAPRVMTLATRKRLEAKRAKDAAAAVATADSLPTCAHGRLKSGDELRAALRAGKQEYVPTTELSLYPLTGSAKTELAKCVELLHASDWERNFEGLTDLRRIAVHAPDVVGGQLTTLVDQVVKQISNLRSSIAKNAMLAIETLCVSLTRKMDPEMDTVIPLLLKRAADTNAFLSEAAAQTLAAVVQTCSAGKVLAALFPHATSKHVLVRKHVAVVVGTILLAEGHAGRLEGFRDFDRCLSLLCALVSDSNNEVRDAAKPTLIYVKSLKFVDSARLQRAVPSATLVRVEHVLQSTVVPDDVTRAASAQEKQLVGSKHATKALKPTVDVAVAAHGSMQDELSTMVVALESSNWKDRYDAVEACKSFVHHHASSLCQSGKLVQLFDTFNKRLDDGNAKVTLCALDTLVDVIPALGNGVDAVLANLVPTYVLPLAFDLLKESKTDIRDATQTLVRALFASMGSAMLDSAYKLPKTHQDKLGGILGVRI